jgi:hypothetical protein
MVAFTKNGVLICCCLSVTVTSVSHAFQTWRSAGRQSTASLLAASSEFSRMLYQDQQDAMLRRALVEQEILASNTLPMLAPKFKPTSPKAGTGFGAASVAASETPMMRLAVEQAKVVRKEGALRIDSAMTDECADALRAHVLEEQNAANLQAEDHPELSTKLFGVENARKHRCDLQLSLLRGGHKADHGGQVPEGQNHAVADALQELFGSTGTLRHIYENLVTSQGEFYELAAVITNPGSDRQQVHPDLPFQSDAPLYVVFLALQDVTLDMGPTSFLPRTHTLESIELFNDHSKRDDFLRKSKCVVSTLNKGDAVLFDARLLHCGNANISNSTRVLFNFSFRNPKVVGSLGYKGSMRPKYVKQMNLADVAARLEDFRLGVADPYARYGDGLSAV